MTSGTQLARSYDISSKVATLYQRRVKFAQDQFNERVRKAYQDQVADLVAKPMSPMDIWTNWYRYAVDFAQRSVLFWDTLRQRGNNFSSTTQQGQPPRAALRVRDGARRAQARSARSTTRWCASSRRRA